MSSLKTYLKDYAAGIGSLLAGMRTSMKVFCRKKVTEQYPENRHTTLHVPERHRALLVMPTDEEGRNACVACGLCQAACPNGSIRIESETVTDGEGRKRRVLRRYEYNLGSCMFCALCVDACAHDAIRFTNDFEQAVFRRDRLVLTLNKV